MYRKDWVRKADLPSINTCCMRFIPFLFLLLIISPASRAQAPSVVKALGSTITVPKNKDQEGWKFNEWNGLFFYQGTGTGFKLCVTDGTNAGTIFLSDLSGTVLKATIPARDFMYIITNTSGFSPGFTSTDYIYKSDGTTAGTSLVYTMPAITSFSIGNCWTSDRDLTRNYSVSGNTLFFGGYDATNGGELWMTDGTGAGTHIVKDIKTGTGNSLPFAFCRIGSEVFFTAMASGLERKLWKTDGTDAGTVQVPVAEPFFVLDNAVGIVNNKMIFYAHNTVDGYEPYVSDGTAAGTFMLKNINAAGNSWLSQSQNAHLRFNSRYCFFIAFNGAANALWRTDGTTAGTIQLTADALAVFSNVSGGSYTEVDDTGFWMIEYNSAGSGSSEKLYRSDGTIAGTYLAANGLSFAQYLKLYNGALWMASRNTGSPANVEPWRSGGNAATTGKVFEIAPGTAGSPTFTPISSNPFGFFVKNNALYFFASSNAVPDLNLYQYQGSFRFMGTSNNNWADSTNWSGGFPPGSVDSVSLATASAGAISISGGNAYAGILNTATGNLNNIQLAGATDSLIISQRLIAADNSIGGTGVLVLRSTGSDTVQVNEYFTTERLAVLSPAGFSKSAAATIREGIELTGELNLQNGSVAVLNDARLSLMSTTGSITTGTGSYIITNGSSSLRINSIGGGGRTGAVSFPVGSTNYYNPATISNTGVSTSYDVAVRPDLHQQYTGRTGSTPVTINAVNSVWFIDSPLPGTNTTITLQWNAAQELPGFDRTQSRLGHYTAGAWDPGAAGNATGAGPYTYSRTGFGSFSPFAILNNSFTLPLRFLSFTTRYTGNNEVQLNWKTADEQRVAHFEIERSTDGIHYTTITTVNAWNQSLNSYSHTDRIAGLPGGLLYYRIRQLDLDGRSAYSKVNTVSLSAVSAIFIYPNPAKDRIYISGSEALKSIRIADMQGRVVLETSSIYGQVALGGLSRGMYTVLLLQKNGEIIRYPLLLQ